MRILLAALISVALAGCVSISRTEGTRIDREKVLEIKAGTTTRQSVIEAFGNPTEAGFENNEEKLVYVFKEKKTPGYLGGIIENEAQSKESTSTLEIVLRDGIVHSYRFKSSQN